MEAEMRDLELAWNEMEDIDALDDELDETFEEIDLYLEGSRARSTSIDPCAYSYTVSGFEYTASSLTAVQRSLVAGIAKEILTALAKAKEVKITGYSSGTRRLELHAARRAKSVSDELKKQLRSLGAKEEDVAKISFGDPVTKPVSSQAASDPKFRKVEICIIHKTRPIKPKPPVPTDPDIDYPAYLESKLRKSLEYIEEFDLEPNPTTVCLMKKLMDPRTNDLWLDPAEISAYLRYSTEKTLPIRNLRDDLIDDLRKGYGRGAIEKYISRFEVIHMKNLFQTFLAIYDDYSCSVEITGRGPKCREVMGLLSRLAKDSRSIYSCRALRELILGKD
jgi:hypothetical protein